GPDRPAAAPAGDDRARAGARGPFVRRRRVRGNGASRLLRPARRRGAPERAEHDPRLYDYERVREALRGLRDPVPRARRPPRAARPRPARAPLTVALLALGSEPRTTRGRAPRSGSVTVREAPRPRAPGRARGEQTARGTCP